MNEFSKEELDCILNWFEVYDNFGEPEGEDYDLYTKFKKAFEKAYEDKQ